MTFEQYNEQRQGLLNSVEELINNGDFDGSEEKMKEVQNLDNKWEQVKLANANLNALKDKNAVTNIQNKGVTVLNQTIIDATSNNAKEDVYASLDYRKAFMNNILAGTPIPEQFNADANTKKSDVGSVIPTVVLEKIIEKMESVGNILPLVTRTTYKGGLSIPTSTVKPVATWVSEGSGSDRQKKTTGSITFNYYKLRCSVSVSLEVDTVSLPVFEATLVNNCAQAMVKALEQSIINGTGSGQPKGILAETVVSGQNVDITLAGKPDYQTLIDAEAALPLAYESEAVWCMTKKTFMRFIGMVDSQKQPIARVNYGINGKPERSLLGRSVVLNDYMDSLVDAPAATSVVAFLFNFNDYVLNTNYNVTMKRFEDNNTDDLVTKCIMLADGKVVDVNSLVTITKKNA